MKFGILKSKIEDTLMESYRTKTVKKEIKNFKKYVLENKNINKLFTFMMVLQKTKVFLKTLPILILMNVLPYTKIRLTKSTKKV